MSTNISIAQGRGCKYGYGWGDADTNVGAASREACATAGVRGGALGVWWGEADGFWRGYEVVFIVVHGLFAALS